jgi:hypothetical protein
MIDCGAVVRESAFRAVLAKLVAVVSDAAQIVEEIGLLKTRTSGATRTAATADPIE